jgi:putative peptide zinc metalloprotease protein
MNLSEALDAALPEMPKTRLSRSRPPRLDPDLVVREDVLDGEASYGVLQRDKGQFFRMVPDQWKLASLFDGVNSYQEIADLYSAETGTLMDSDSVRQFAENMAEIDFWYKSAQEKNLALGQKLTDQRARRADRTSKINLAHITFSAWDPDRYFEWLNRVAGRFIYSGWCVLAVVLLFIFEASVFISKWSFIGPDIPLYYNFAHKSLIDLAQFWMLFLILGFLHESAHGLTCKHYGGQVHAMGLMFMYLMPAFYCDVTEVWISATRIQRLATIIAGIWIEMVICGVAMIVWSNTLAGQWVHDFAYEVILITGIAVVVVNLNPLIKLDGYYFFTEAIGIPDLKERSTAFLSGWFQNKILRIPAETPVIPRRRAPLFIFYALASGAYSYMLLYFVIRLSYNITSKWLAEFALIPTAWVAFSMFRSRLKSLRGVAEGMWEQHFDGGRRLRPAHAIAAIVLAAVLFLPLLRDRENAWYVIEPLRADTLHAAVSGRVEAVLVHEGESVQAGQPMLSMTSVAAASLRSAATAQAGSARFRMVTAEMHGESIGGAAAEQTASARSDLLAATVQSSQVVRAPTDATVLTQDPAALLDQDVAPGQPLINLAEAGPRMVRVYIPVSALERVHPGAEVALALPDSFAVVRVPLAQLGGDQVSLPQGLVANQDYKGIKLPVFYSARMALPASAGNPMFGLSGQAKIFGARQSLAARLFIMVRNLAKAHFW